MSKKYLHLENGDTKAQDLLLDNVSDVDVLDPAHGDRLAWDDSLLKWVPKSSISGLSIITFDYRTDLPSTATPSEGRLSRNTDDPLLTTILYVNHIDNNGEVRDRFWGEIKEGDWFNIYESNSPDNYESYDAIGDASELNGVWAIPVAVYEVAGDPLANNNRVTMLWRISPNYSHEVLVNRDALDCHPIDAITGLKTELLSKMNWRNKWVDGIYYANDVVTDSGYTMVANKQTTDKPAPALVGDPIWLYDGTGATEQQVSAKQIIFGNRYEVVEDLGEITKIRLSARIGSSYDIYTIHDPLGSPIFELLYSFDGDVNGWKELNILPTIVQGGTLFDVVAVEHESDPVSTQWTGDWNYTTPNNDGTPNNGDMIHASKNIDEIHINYLDDAGTDRKTELLAQNIGDTFSGAGMPWTIQSVVDNGSYVTYRISPNTQGSSGLGTFTFNTITAIPLKYDSDDDYWLGAANRQGLFIADGKWIDIVPNDNAYGIDIFIQKLDVSDDWDILAHSESTSGGGGDPVVSSDKYREPMNTGLNFGGIIAKGTADLDVDIALGTGIIVDAVTDPLNIIETDISWLDQTITITPTAINTHEIHNIYINSDGVGFSVHLDHIQPNNAYDNILLGWLELQNNVIYGVIPAPTVIGQTSYSLGVLFQNMTDESKTKGFRVHGSSGLNVYCEKGTLLLPGINWNTTPKDQHKVDIPQSGDELNPITLGFFNQNAQPVIGAQTDMPKYYDDAGAITPLTGGEAVIHYMFYSAGGFNVQIGDKKYIDFADAFRNIDQDRDNFNYAPGADVSGRSILIAQIVISKLADDFSNKSLADIVSVINGESGNTISPIDLTLVPQYLLSTEAAEDLVMGDLLSMDVNGNLQKYPASGGEGNSQYTTDNVDVQAAQFLNDSNNQGVICWRNDTSTNVLNFVTAQGNANGSISYSPVGTLTVGNNITTIRLCDTNNIALAGLTWIDDGGVYLGQIRNQGLGSAPTIGVVQNIDGGSIQDTDVCYDSSQGNLICVYCFNNYVYNRYCTRGNDDVHSPPKNRVGMNSCLGDSVRCVTEGNNVIAVSIYAGVNSYWVESAWDKPIFSTGLYNDLTNVRGATGGNQHCGLQVQSGTILAQFGDGTNVQTYMNTYSSGGSMNTPSAYGLSIAGVSADLIKTNSGIGYSVVLKSTGVLEYYEGTLQGTYQLVYTSTLNIGTTVTSIQALMFGSVFAVGAIGDYTWSNQVIMVDSSVTRTDHFIAVAPSAIVQGQRFNADIALPMLTLPREYSPGTMYEYGPYKYQVITHNQAVMIIEATTIQTQQAME